MKTALVLQYSETRHEFNFETIEAVDQENNYLKQNIHEIIILLQTTL